MGISYATDHDTAWCTYPSRLWTTKKEARGVSEQQESLIQGQDGTEQSALGAWWFCSLMATGSIGLTEAPGLEGDWLGVNGEIAL